MDGDSLMRFKWILIVEALLAGAFVSLTRAFFVIYLVSIDTEVRPHRLWSLFRLLHHY